MILAQKEASIHENDWSWHRLVEAGLAKQTILALAHLLTMGEKLE
jgi:hypothetical protein